MEVTLRKLSINDTQQIAKLLNNKRIWDNLTDSVPYPYTLDDAEWFIDFECKDKQLTAFAILYKEEFCGIISLTRQADIYRMNAELGYWVGEPFWGKGIASEAIRKVLQIGFGEIKLERIFAGVFDFNKPSMRVLEKNGFKQEGIFRNAVLKNNQLMDEYIFAKLK